MAPYNRRTFLKTTGGLLSTAALGTLALGCESDPDTAETTTTTTQGPQDLRFKYAMCNEAMMGTPWQEQCRIMADAGYEAVEIAPFSLVTDYGYKDVTDFSAAERAELKRIMDEAGLACVGLHWLLAPPPEGLHLTTNDAQVRQRTIDYLDALIDFSGDLGGPYMIFGSPKQRNALDMTVDEAKQRFADGLRQVAEHAQERGVKILVEPLTKDQTDVVNSMAEAMEVVGLADHPAIGTMFDFHNTADETEPMAQLIRDYFDEIDHIQIQEMDGRHLGTGNAVNDFVPVFEALAERGYDGWISLEVFDFEPGGEVIAQESMETLRQIEAKLREV